MSWDDGKHAKVNRVKLTFDDVINSIEVEYDGTSLKSQPRGTVGIKSDEFTLSCDEYITEVNGYYRTVFSGDVITALTFKTNKKTYGTYGTKTRNYFSLTAPKNNQIAGFLGSSGNVLNSLDAHFAPVPLLGSTGSNAGNTGTGTYPGADDTGGSNDGNTGTGTYPGAGGTGGSNAVNTGTNHGASGTGSNAGNTGTGTYPGAGGTGGINAGNTGSGTNPNAGGTGGINDGNTGTPAYPHAGNFGAGSYSCAPPNTGTGTYPGAGGTGGSNAGNTGTGTYPGTGAQGSGSNIGGSGSNPGGSGGSNAGNTGTNPGASGTGSNPGSTGTNTGSSPQKLEAQGGKEGNQWDDGANHDGVVKIHAVYSGLGIEQIRFDYVKNEQSKEGSAHGVKRRGQYTTVDINHPDEYLVSVEGWYDSSNIIQGIQFKTNTKTSEVIGYPFSGDGTQFSLQVKDKKIIGFHGFADSHLNSIGAYFVPISTSSSSSSSSSSSLSPPPTKVEAQGGNYGETFDDGAFDHVTKVYVGQGDSGVAYVKFDYEKDGKKESREHGTMTLLEPEEFEVDSDDYITSVEVYVDRVYGFKSDIVTSLIFKTFKGKTSQPFGIMSENMYELKDGKGGKLAGFHGKASDVLYALGAYFAPTTTSTTPLTPSPTKVEAKGGDYGEAFDDGAFDHVRKVYVGQGDSGVAYVKFDYEKDGEKESREHGTMTILGTEKFEVDSGDYITSVEVYVDKVYGFKSDIVTSLIFKTFKGKTSQPFGMMSENKYELKDGKGGKLAGFHGKASDVVYAIGAYFTPTTL